MHQRLVALRELLRERDLPALLVMDAANRRYLSGFTGSYGALLITTEAALIFTDSRYVTQVARQVPEFYLRQVTTEAPLLTLVAQAAQELGLQLVGLESDVINLDQYLTLKKRLGEQIAIVPTKGIVEGLREVKDAEEIATLRRAVAITDAALTKVLPQLRPDHTELDAAWMLEVAMREGGAEALAFTIIVAAGLNAALPHARPSSALLGSGQPIIIDMGARVDGYHADMTRTIVLGEPDERFRTIYSIVLEAEQRAIAGMAPGALNNAIDALARDHIAAAGYGDYFGHGLGHGVGLVIHEGPGLRRLAAEQSPVALKAGNVITVEPGIYLPDWGGVRIEDLVLVTETGHEILSQAPKFQV